MKHDDGGPAYPDAYCSKTILDEFAMHVSAGVYTTAASMSELNYSPEQWRDHIAQECFLMAAAMIAEKRRREGGAK